MKEVEFRTWDTDENVEYLTGLFRKYCSEEDFRAAGRKGGRSLLSSLLDRLAIESAGKDNG